MNFFSNFSQFLNSFIYSCLLELYIQLYKKNSHCIEFQIIKWCSKFISIIGLTFHNFVRFCLSAWGIFYSFHHMKFCFFQMLSSERKTNTFSKEIRLGCLQNQSAEGTKPWENTASKYYNGNEARTCHKCIFSENVNQTRYCFCYINSPSWVNTVMTIKFTTWWSEQKCKQRWNNNIIVVI